MLLSLHELGSEPVPVRSGFRLDGFVLIKSVFHQHQSQQTYLGRKPLRNLQLGQLNIKQTSAQTFFLSHSCSL